MIVRFACAAVILAVTAAPAFAEGDAAKGASVYKTCMACHAIDDATNKTGPSLKGLIGRKVASVEGYAYSEAMKAYAATVPVWDEASFDTYIAKPRDAVKGTKMAFVGIKDAGKRADLIAFLKSKQ
ncbi:MAG: c-type cytochrome [Aestuariivirga sp.]